MSENGEIYTAGKNFTLPLAVTALTNSNSEDWLNHPLSSQCMFIMVMVSSSLVCLVWPVWITNIRKRARKYR